MESNQTDSPKLRQYIMTGLGLGLYFGWFFRPVREPNLLFILGLSVVITIVMTLLRLWRGEREQLLRRAATTFIQYAFVLAILEARHYAYDHGGRFGVITMTTLMGGVSGYWMAQRPQSGFS